MKAILIARVSTEEQRDAGNSLPAQLARLEKYCQNKNFEIIRTFSFDESAYKEERDEFYRILDFVLSQKEKIAVCCDKVDRLSRNMFDKRISALYDKALTDDIELHFASDGQIITSRISAVEKFQFSISLGLAKYYSDAISDNVKRALEQKLRKGEWLAKAPYGYKHIVVSNANSGRTKIEVDEFTAHIIKKVFELYATGAYSMKLLKEKLKEKHNLDWSVSYIGLVLNNPFYHGTMVVKGKKYPHRYPPLISRTLFDEVQVIKKRFNKKPFKYAGKPYIYRGLIRCGDCGLAITPEKHKGHGYYHCTQYKGKHGAKWFREDKITHAIAHVFKCLQIPKEVREKIANTIEELDKCKAEFHKKEYDKLMREQATTQKMLDNLYLDKLKGSITERDYDKFYQQLSEQSQNIQIRLDQLQEADDNYIIMAKHLLKLTKLAFDLFDGSEVEGKRVLIKLVLSNLRIEGEKLLWELNKPFDLIVECSEHQLWLGRKDSNLRCQDQNLVPYRLATPQQITT